MIKFEGGEGLSEVVVLMNYDLMNKVGFRTAYMEGR